MTEVNIYLKKSKLILQMFLLLSWQIYVQSYPEEVEKNCL